MSESMPSIEKTTEVIRDEGSPLCEEICHATGCSRTGPPSRYGEQGQTFRSASEQGADTLEGGCRGWRRLERQRDSACAGHVDRDGRTGSPAACRGGFRVDLDAQAQSQFGQKTNIRR